MSDDIVVIVSAVILSLACRAVWDRIRPPRPPAPLPYLPPGDYLTGAFHVVVRSDSIETRPLR
jgi:hypothetical protein